MPIYPYVCNSCGEKQDVISSIDGLKNIEPHCSQCGELMGSACRRIADRQFFYGDFEEAQWNPGLGCVTKSKTHRKEICKARGLVELGNDIAPDQMFKEQDKQEENRTKALTEDIMRGLN